MNLGCGETQRPGGRTRSRLLASLLLATLLAILSGTSMHAAEPQAQPIVLTTAGSPFDPDGDGDRENVTIGLELAAAATVELTVHDFDGRRLRTLARKAKLGAGQHGWKWNGRDSNGRKVPYGPYRIRAWVRTEAAGLKKRFAWVTRAARRPYAIRPGAIVVALDPGHGGPAGGAASRGLVEDDVNLDIGLRLEAMLRGAGIGVVMTRKTDRNVSPVGKDLNGDHRYTRVDELIARNDIGNQARADLHIAIHNNASVCHCTRGTEMYTHGKRGWSPQGRILARAVLDAHGRHLMRIPGYNPKKRGVKTHPFKALKPYHPRAMPRPSLQPSILGESLFMDWPSERRILRRRSGRTVIAAAYFDGIARFLNQRRHGLRYEVLSAPKSIAAGGEAQVTLRVTNRGHSTSSGWRVVARVVPAVPRYDGRPRRGDVVRRVPVPDGLGPGETVDVTVAGVPMPTRKRWWLLKFDVDLPGGGHLSTRGVVGPQLRVRTVRP